MLKANPLNISIKHFSHQVLVLTRAFIVIISTLNNQYCSMQSEIAAVTSEMPHSSSSAIRFQITIGQLTILRYAIKFNWLCCGNLGIS